MTVITLLKVFYIILLIVTNIKLIICDVNFDENDILNMDFMPGSLLMIDKDTNENFDNITANLIHKKYKSLVSDNRTSTLDGGNFNEAFSTMKFHRKMMNEYLCHNFLADQILDEITPAKLFKRRMAEKPMPFQTTESPKKRTGRLSSVAAVKENLLTDPGSSNYKDWLSKTTTLEDIYRHYGTDGKVNNRIDSNDLEFDTHREEFDSDVTGFAVQGIVNPIPSSPRVPTVPNMPKVGASGYGGGYTGYGHSSGGYQEQHLPAHYAIPVVQSHSGGGHEYSHQQHHEPQHHEPQHFVHYHHKGNKKEMILKDLFDIALTALAFLSFGIFAIQVILCIAATTVTTTTTQATFLSMVDGTGTGTGTGTGGTATGTTAASGPSIIIANDAILPPVSGNADNYGNNGNNYGNNHNGYKSQRNRRDTSTPLFSIENSLRNEIARRVLVSMEAIFIAEQDNGNCLRREICANNKYSRTLSNNQRLWIPVYGLALSWLTGRLSTNMAPAPAMLESLKASALGLGNADCDAIYPNCNINNGRDERLRRRRRKRSTNGTDEFK